jgi:hypothetical protein
VLAPCCNGGVTTHSGCFWDTPQEVALAYGNVRGLQLVRAQAQDDKRAIDAVLDEIGDCAQCLRNMVALLSGMASSIAISMTENAGGPRSLAINQMERQLADARAELDRLR